MENRFFTRLLVTVLAAFAVCYTVWLAYRFFAPTYRTETAFSYTVADSCRVRAVAVRDEQVLTSSQDGVYDYLCDDGEVVLQHTPVADVYQNAQDLARQELAERCEQEIAMLRRAESAGVQPFLTENLSAQINDAAGSLIDSTARSSLDDLSARRENLQYLLSKKLLASGKATDFSARISLLESQKAAAESAITSSPGTVRAGVAGYFCAATDGYETLLPSDCSQLTVGMLRGILDGSTQPLSYANAVGKVQKDFRWNLAFFVDSEQAEEFQKGASVTLNFGVSGATEIPATVSDVREEDGETLIVLTCDRLSHYLINVRIVSVEVKFRSYSGLRIRKDAVRYVGQTEGVYVKSGNLVEFKPIERIYEDETYLLCSDAGNLENSLEQFDEVIVEGRDLYDGKFLG